MKAEMLNYAVDFYDKTCRKFVHDRIKIDMELINEIARLKAVEQKQNLKIDMLIETVASLRREK